MVEGVQVGSTWLWLGEGSRDVAGDRAQKSWRKRSLDRVFM